MKLAITSILALAGAAVVSASRAETAPASKIVVHSEAVIPTHTVEATRTVTQTVTATPEPHVRVYGLAENEAPLNVSQTYGEGILLKRTVVDVVFERDPVHRHLANGATTTAGATAGLVAACAAAAALLA